MRVRIKQDPEYPEQWRVEVKHWWYGWLYKSSYSGDNAQERAFAVACRLINPITTEVFK